MAICPHCQSTGEALHSRCPSGDGFYLIAEEDYQSHSDDPWLGRRIGDRFVISSILGQGSIGYVYKAYQEQVDRMVAIKLFDTQKMDKSRARRPGAKGNQDRFIQEARVLAKLSHPNCVTLYDFGYAANERFLYIAMEHVGGISLRRAVRRGVKLEAVYEVIRQVLMALREAHALEIVHRDLKPENIILSYRRTSDEQIVKVLDFGIAKLLQSESPRHTMAGLLFGTPAYMSPEQCRGETEVTPASDIYSLGCMVFEMVTGHLPFESNYPQEMVRMHQLADIPPMVPRGKEKLPPGFEGFVRTCMAKLPEERFPNAAVALAAFEKIVGDAQSGQLAQGLDRLGDEKQKLARRVSVPKNVVTGAVLDPTGERPRPNLEEVEEYKRQKEQRKSVELNTSATGKQRVTDTFRGAESSPAKKAPALARRFAGRNGLLIAAVFVVAIFCTLLFVTIYLTVVQ